MAGPVIDGEYLKEIERARADLRALISSKNCALIMIKLAWNDAGKYDKTTKTCGPNGSIRFEEEEDGEGYITDLETAIYLLEPIKEEHRRITYADLFQLAGVVAIEVTGGPSIDFSPGRRDSFVCPKNGRLPIAKKGSVTLRDIFYLVGLSDKDIVALSGVHTLVDAREPVKFDNSYFIKLLKLDSLGILNNPIDEALIEDPVFRSYIELYAKDKDVFFRDYAESHKKFSEVGFVPPSISKGAKVDAGFTLLAHGVVGVAAAAVMLFLRHVYVISKKK
ncbi:putative L-ascorbate peroxidase 4 [Platanthera guangdongensis]|uniref:L-ascorbate peroxidase n=1 Tax=Platanthera guangdongensis TaxID=2320717 RepID=A0ABR2MQT9_9ASPA